MRYNKHSREFLRNNRIYIYSERVCCNFCSLLREVICQVVLFIGSLVKRRSNKHSNKYPLLYIYSLVVIAVWETVRESTPGVTCWTRSTILNFGDLLPPPPPARLCGGSYIPIYIPIYTGKCTHSRVSEREVTCLLRAKVSLRVCVCMWVCFIWRAQKCRIGNPVVVVVVFLFSLSRLLDTSVEMFVGVFCQWERAS